MPTCAFPTCKKRTGPEAKRLGISFHRFPSGKEFQLIWTSLVQKARINAYWKPHATTSICSEHFEEKYIYFTNSGKSKLVKNAIPTKKIAIFADEDEVFAEAEAVAQSSSAKTEVAINVDENDGLAEAEAADQPSSSKTEAAINVYEIEVLAEAETAVQLSSSNTNCGQSVGCPQHSPAVSNMEDLTLTPREAKLMKSLEKKEKNCKKHLRTIKNLNRKLKRQVKKNECLKNILKNFKNNRNLNEDVFQILSANIVEAELL